MVGGTVIVIFIFLCLTHEKMVDHRVAHEKIFDR